MARPTLFGMVSTRASKAYTLPALQSFLENTKLAEKDRLVLIDNDDSIPAWHVPCESIVPIKPRSFAANVNSLLDMADEYQQDLCFISNDIHFAPGWWEPLRDNDQKAILIPNCNQNNQYTMDGLTIDSVMNLATVANRLDKVDAVAAFSNQATAGTFFTTRLMAFYAFKLSREVYKDVGYMDTGFGTGGAEDVDYRLRAIQHNIPTAYVGGTYLLHYNGKSTWDGVETASEIDARNQAYQTEFVNKWGQDLADLCLSMGDTNAALARRNLVELAAAGNWHVLLKQVLDAGQ